MIYIKRIARADITRQIDLSEEPASSFFSFDSEVVAQRSLVFQDESTNTRYSGSIKKSGHSITITGRIFSFVKQKCEEGDIVVFSSTRSNTQFRFHVIKKTDNEFSGYDHALNLFGSRSGVIKKTTHLIASIDDESLARFSPLQRIYYGAPGTGKSNEIKNLTGENGGGIKFEKDCTFRTTFHPDSDYASFVGAYKPYWDKKQNKIVYGFRPQAFLKAYIKAWKNPDKNVALVVEEINRGNCAQIFGDIFQLLDREKNGLSKYPIESDVEMQEFIAEEFRTTNDFDFDEKHASNKEGINSYYLAHYDDAFDKIKNGEILALPMNLSILATMNTSDQSLFPMDSAFKRRWEWIYEPIVEGTKIDDNNKESRLDWKIEIDNNRPVDWWKFLQKINAVIYSLTSSEDKQLGYFFCQPDKDGKTISQKLFVGKVIFYLWNEIFKDYVYDHPVCKKGEKDTLYFADFYESKDNINSHSLEIFFKNLDENQPKIKGQDVKLIEEKESAENAATEGKKTQEGEETPQEVNPEQAEETPTENAEA